MLHDAESEPYQKLLVADIFPGMLLIGNISVTKYATTVKQLFRTYKIRRINWYIWLRAIVHFNFC